MTGGSTLIMEAVFMSDRNRVIQTSQGWFVETAQGRVGPMESKAEADTYLKLMRVVQAAGREIACTDNECF